MQEDIREKIKGIRTKRGITYKFLAAEAGINYSTFRNFVNGRNFTEENLMKAKFLLEKYKED